MTAKKKPKSEVEAIHDELASELVSLIPSLDVEGLAFLVEQARVHLYNMSLDREAAAEAEVSAAAGGKPAVAGTPRTAADLRTADFRVERSSSGSSYHIIAGGKWKMYNEAEMLAIVRIAQSKDPLPEVTGRLHEWFAAERPDTFADLELGDKHDPKLKELVQFLRKKFNVRGAK